MQATIIWKLAVVIFGVCARTGIAARRGPSRGGGRHLRNHEWVEGGSPPFYSYAEGCRWDYNFTHSSESVVEKLHKEFAKRLQDKDPSLEQLRLTLKHQDGDGAELVFTSDAFAHTRTDCGCVEATSTFLLPSEAALQRCAAKCRDQKISDRSCTHFHVMDLPDLDVGMPGGPVKGLSLCFLIAGDMPGTLENEDFTCGRLGADQTPNADPAPSPDYATADTRASDETSTRTSDRVVIVPPPAPPPPAAEPRGLSKSDIIALCIGLPSGVVALAGIIEYIRRHNRCGALPAAQEREPSSDQSSSKSMAMLREDPSSAR